MNFNQCDDNCAMQQLLNAAHKYKLAKEWRGCAETHENLAKCYIEMGDMSEAANAYVSAAGFWEKTVDQSSAAPRQEMVSALHEAVKLYARVRRLIMAARQLRSIGDELDRAAAIKAWEGDVAEEERLRDDAIRCYSEAADLFDMESAHCEVFNCRLKIAETCAELGRYSSAVDRFEGAAMYAAKTPLLKYSARDYLLHAGLCCLCYMSPDHIDARLDRYRKINLEFNGSRNDDLLRELAAARRELDDVKFAKAVAMHEIITMPNPWKAKLLRDAKRIIEELRGDDEGLRGIRGVEER